MIQQYINTFFVGLLCCTYFCFVEIASIIAVLCSTYCEVLNTFLKILINFRLHHRVKAYEIKRCIEEHAELL